MSEELIAAATKVLAKTEDIVAAFVFGSVARGEARPDSDVDVGVLFGRVPQTNELDRLTAALEEATARDVDLTVMETAPDHVVRRIFREGERVVDHDPVAVAAFEADHGPP